MRFFTHRFTYKTARVTFFKDIFFYKTVKYFASTFRTQLGEIDPFTFYHRLNLRSQKPYR